MKRLLVMFVLLLSASAWAAVIPATQVVKVNPRIYALLGPIAMPDAHNQGYMVNSTLIIGDHSAILIDTGFTDEIGTHLGQEVAKLTDKPIKFIINTHHHGDHTLGNAAFFQAKVISSEMCRKLVIEQEADWLAILESAVGRKFPNTHAVPATEVYASKTKTDVVLDGVKLTFWVPAGSHTAGDMMIWLPDDQVLVGGDILVNQVMPSFRDAQVKNWIGTLAEVQALPAKTLIPGHGPLMKIADVVNMHDRMATFYAAIETGYKAGLTDSEIRKQLDLSQWTPLNLFDHYIGEDINKAYLEIEASAF